MTNKTKGLPAEREVVSVNHMPENGVISKLDKEPIQSNGLEQTA